MITLLHAKKSEAVRLVAYRDHGHIRGAVKPNITWVL